MKAPDGRQRAELHELTFRAVALGVLITLVFTAANVYLGLKVGLTFASTIPAAVISMAVLGLFKDSTILENNIVQTLASAAGTLSAIIFVLPGLVIVGWWTGFPFWESFLICVAGGVLGVTFTIPLRRALVTTSPLPYPEGVAAAEVLKVGSQARGGATPETREGLLAVVIGSMASAGLAIFIATRLAAAQIGTFFRVGAGATGVGGSFSLGLMGVGHLVGLSTGLAMLFGLIIAWGAAVPILTAMFPQPDASLADHATEIWRNKVRFIGAGTIGIAAIWTLGGLARPVLKGLVTTLSFAKVGVGTSADQTDRDLSPLWIVALSIACLAVAGELLRRFAAAAGLDVVPLVAAALIALVLLGFVVAAICGYMAGLIGSSNSPISGVGILAVVISALVYMAVASTAADSSSALAAFTLFATSIVFSAATIANGNLQDLKTGQLVGAAPWRQQVALILGVFAGAIVIPPVLDVLAQAYGFAGAPRAATTVTAQPLAAPQAGLISALAQGVIEQKIDWGLVGIGAAIGAAVIALDRGLRAVELRHLPPLAVGIGVYLPMETTVPVVLGALIGWWYESFAARTRDPARTKRLGVLVASGLIVGESLFGVLLAALIVGFNRDAPLALMAEEGPWALALGAAAFAALIVFLYRWMMRRAERA
ncbi:MAG: OPT family oligopeptide transporter [Alphaproteobacteria bacterium]